MPDKGKIIGGHKKMKYEKKDTQKRNEEQKVAEKMFKKTPLWAF